MLLLLNFSMQEWLFLLRSSMNPWIARTSFFGYVWVWTFIAAKRKKTAESKKIDEPTDKTETEAKKPTKIVSEAEILAASSRVLSIKRIVNGQVEDQSLDDVSIEENHESEDEEEDAGQKTRKRLVFQSGLLLFVLRQ